MSTHPDDSGPLRAPLTRGVQRAVGFPGGSSDISSVFGCRWKWLLAMGLSQLLAGAAALVVPFLATLFAAASFGWILVFTGVFQIFHAYRVRRWQGFALHFAGGLLYAAAGVLILFNPTSGLMSLTLLLAGLLIFEGVLRVGMAYRVHPRDGWLWFVLGGSASVILGAVILLGWPGDSTWVMGLVLGVELLLAGAINIPLAFTCRARQRDTKSALAALG